MKGWLLLCFLGWIAGWVGGVYARRFLLQPIADRQSAEDRRKKLPVGKRANKPPPPLLDAEWEEKDVDVTEGFFSLKNKKSLYWCTLVPKDVKKVERVLIYFHGITGSSAYLEFNAMATFAKLGNCAAIGFDMPGHGRSDGDHVYIEDWHSFVGCAIQFVERFAKTKVTEWSEQVGRPLKLFALGESMGGGVVTTMSLKRPDIFDGLVLYSPMIAVSEETMPAPIVVWVFKNILVPILPDWPIAPAKDLGDMCCSDPAQNDIIRANPFGIEKTKFKLRTAQALAFEAPPWMEARLEKLSTPFLIVHSAGDRITDPKQSQKLYDRASATDKTIKLYPNAQHMDPLHGGPKARALVQTTYNDIIAWLKARS